MMPFYFRFNILATRVQTDALGGKGLINEITLQQHNKITHIRNEKGINEWEEVNK